ncbi:MAG TPA: tetratricopeptide repeat protein [Mucilaginibacter sp.]|nr:tetratricopeptide repeat protein [Mucilaginibacter sp.]
MSSKYNTEDIVKFINGHMDDAGADIFRQAMQEDAALAEEVEAQRKLARLVQVASIKQQLDNIHQEYTSEKTNVIPGAKHTKTRYMWQWIVAAAAIAGIGLFLFLYRVAPSANDKLFAEHFKDDDGVPSLMGNSTTSFDDAMVYYKAGDYQQAASKFDLLLAAKPGNDSLKYYEALCQVRLKNEDKALQLLSAISATPGNELGLKAKWYTALVLIHQNKSKEAVAILGKLTNPEFAYSKKASALLKELSGDK